MGVSFETVDFDTVTFKVFFMSAALLVLKMYFMVPLIGRQRFLKKVVISPEDTIFRKGLKVRNNDPDVERPRRAFLNDLENIIIFLAIASIYCMLKPSPIIAIPLLVAYVFARFGHTFVYAVVVKKQPSRFICYAVGWAITAYMAGYVANSLKDAM